MKEKQNNVESRSTSVLTFTAKLALLSATSKQTCFSSAYKLLAKFCPGHNILPVQGGLPVELQ